MARQELIVCDISGVELDATEPGAMTHGRPVKMWVGEHGKHICLEVKIEEGDSARRGIQDIHPAALRDMLATASFTAPEPPPAEEPAEEPQSYEPSEETEED